MKTESIEEKEKEPVRIATIIGIISVILNLLLGVSKVVVGKIMGSNSVFSDGVHGTGDVLTTLIAVISVWIAARKKNDRYNYGHERWSDIACIVLAVILFVTAGTIAVESVTDLVTELTTDTAAADEKIFGSTLWWVSMGLAIASVILKEIMFYITWYGSKKAHSLAMRADAWHQRVDALSSIAAIIALLGYHWLPEKNILDPIFSLPIVVMVVWVGAETFIKASRELTDHAIDPKKLEEVKKAIYEIVPESQVKLIRSRIYSEKFYLDIFVLEKPDSTLKEADDLSDKLKESLFAKFDDLKNVYVIAEPDNELHRNQEETLR
jgi:cation diffusion facilitator family transporter